MIKVALIKFTRGSFDQEYSYLTDIGDLEEGDIVVVPANTSYSTGVFTRYSDSKQHRKLATKVIVQKVDIQAYEDKLFLGGFE